MARPTWLLLAVPMLSACSDGTSAAPAADRPPEPPAALVETVQLVASPFVETLTLTGETTPIRTAVLSSQVPGRIVMLGVTEGAHVTAGSPVLRIDTATVDAQRGQLEAQRQSLARDLTRAEELVARGIGVGIDVDRLRTQIDVLNQQILALDVNVGQGRTAAPISGIVTQRLAEVGEFANPGAPLARIVDVSTVVVVAGLPERELGAVHAEMSVEVTLTATGETVGGRIERIGVEGDVASRTFPIEVHLDNTSGHLRAGMRASITIPKTSFDAAILVPRDAVLQGLSGPEVLVDGGGHAERRAVTLGPGRGAFTVVLDGVVAGDRLIVRGHRTLIPSERIRTVDLGACCAAQLASHLGRPVSSDAEGSAPR